MAKTAMNSDPKAATTLGKSAYEQLRAMILNGSLRGGMRLQEATFADRLGVSRTPVREAIARLVNEGLATRAAGGAPMVNMISLTEIIEILHVRRMLECESARQAASVNFAVEPLIEIRKRIEGFLAGERPDAVLHAQVDEDLHSTISRIAGSKLLAELIQNLRFKTRIFDKGSIPERFEPGCIEHIEIIDSVLAHEPERAEQAMRRHIDNAREAILSHIHRLA